MPLLSHREYVMMDKRKRSLLKGAKDEIELDRMNRQKQGKVMRSEEGQRGRSLDRVKSAFALRDRMAR